MEGFYLAGSKPALEFCTPWSIFQGI